MEGVPEFRTVSWGINGAGPFPVEYAPPEPYGLVRLAFNLEEALGFYPQGVLNKLGIRRIVPCGELRVKGSPADGFLDAASGTAYLSWSLDHTETRRRLHEELCHLLDFRLKTSLHDPEWTALNPADFRYRGYSEETVSNVPSWEHQGFASRRATASAFEDKAVLFAILMGAPAAVWERERGDKVFSAKAALLRRRLEEFHPGFDAAFWGQLGLRYQDLKWFSAPKVVRQIRERYGIVVLQPWIDREEDRKEGEIRYRTFPQKKFDEHAAIFEEVLSYFPGEALRKANLKRIVPSGKVMIGEEEWGGLASDAEGTVYVTVGQGASAARRTLAHEIYHMIDANDGVRRSDRTWRKLNPSGFRYQRMKAGARKGNPTDEYPGFANDYARSAVEEDKAVIFEFIFLHPELMEKWGRSDPILAKKMSLLKERLRQFHPGLGESFWENLRRAPWVEKSRGNFWGVGSLRRELESLESAPDDGTSRDEELFSKAGCAFGTVGNSSEPCGDLESSSSNLPGVASTLDAFMGDAVGEEAEP